MMVKGEGKEGKVADSIPPANKTNIRQTQL